MSKTETPGVSGGARKRHALPNSQSDATVASEDASSASGNAWWAESWTPRQPSPAREPLAWLPAEESLSSDINPRMDEPGSPVRSIADQTTARPPESASNLSVLTIEERRARAAALRALLLARQRRFEPAEQAFREAAALDPALDLSQVTTFWDLERGGHEAAVRAYESLGRVQEAKWLRARVETRYRPRLVRSA